MSRVERHYDKVHVEVERQEFREADPDRMSRVFDPELFLEFCEGGLDSLGDGPVVLEFVNGPVRYISHNAMVDILQMAKAETPCDGDVPPKHSLRRLKANHEQNLSDGPRQ